MKKKIFLATVLKPVDDVRMFEKFAIALAKQYHIVLAGRKVSANRKKEIENFRYYEISGNKTSLFARLKAGKACLKALVKEKPDLVIAHTVELLPFVIAYQWLYHKRVKLFYDIRENFYYNMLYQPKAKLLERAIWALIIRTIELLCAPFIDRFILAEKCYERELPFLNGKATVIENKYKPILQGEIEKAESNKGYGRRFLVCGTLSKVYGIREGVQFFLEWQKRNRSDSLQLLGHCPEEEIESELKGLANAYPEIQLNISGNPVAHGEIIRGMQEADIVLLPYKTNESTRNCIPTKMYECLALGIPMLVQHNKLWEETCAPYQAALFIDFEQPDFGYLSNKFESWQFYPYGNVQDAYWEKDEPNLIKLVDLVLI